MLKGFRDFALRGNVVELAVAVVIGAAFGTVITSLVEDLLTPLIAALVGEPDFSGLSFEVNGTEFSYGNFINALLSFLLIAAAIYFVIVAPLKAYDERHGGSSESRKCPHCLSDIPAEASRCAFCTETV